MNKRSSKSPWRRVARWLAVSAGMVAVVLGGAGCGSSGTSFAEGVRVDELKVRDIGVVVTDTTATISWVTRVTQGSHVYYGPTSRLGTTVAGSIVTRQTTTVDGVDHQAQITGLTANTVYFFQVEGRKTTLRFRTAGGTRTRLAFVSDRLDGRREIYLAHEFGENVTRLTTTGGWSPALSLDGTRVAWVGNRVGGGTDIFLATLDASGLVAGSVQNLTDTADRDEAHPCWSSDGTAVTFSSAGGLVQRVVAGGAETTLIGGRYSFDQPTWRRDGARLAFISNRRTATIQLKHRPVLEGSVSIKVRDHNNSVLAPALYELYDATTGLIDLSAAGVGNLHVRVTYRSGGVLYSDEQYRSPVPRTALYTMAADGTDLRRITDLDYSVASPEWSVSGSQLFYCRESSGLSSILQINADGSSVKALSSGDFLDRDPVVAPDGSGIMFVSNRDANRLVNLWLLPSGQSMYMVNLFSSGDTEPSWSVVP
ncbi:MAG: PD40 domain-containing protein [Armatimonadetes bacterium]|nr:PD40 domain-containing protein [Armatimonadota bacterium]